MQSHQPFICSRRAWLQHINWNLRFSSRIQVSFYDQLCFGVNLVCNCGCLRLWGNYRRDTVKSNRQAANWKWWYKYKLCGRLRMWAGWFDWLSWIINQGWDQLRWIKCWPFQMLCWLREWFEGDFSACWLYVQILPVFGADDENVKTREGSGLNA